MQTRTELYFTFYFCLPLIPLGASLKERDVCLLRVGMPGQRDIVQRYCLFDSVNPGFPGTSSCCATTESCVVCTLSWPSKAAVDYFFLQKTNEDKDGRTELYKQANTGTLVAELQDVWLCGVSVCTGRSGISILLLAEIASLISSLCLSVASRMIL